ncbi:hypothetical protein G9444_6820 (plasmid) [Rhodococcus erythropolis]|uniref:Uncharacterized protein n=1 Tax=Rhodococcus erythropolis TaxID=1833 RepID=A0A6G9D455_RHOER|nr:hypothetical protein G9444_6820 [Rhodococcus erythropolis]
MAQAFTGSASTLRVELDTPHCEFLPRSTDTHPLTIAVFYVVGLGAVSSL